MAEWLRRVIRNHLGSSRAGSNPVQCALLFSYFLGPSLIQIGHVSPSDNPFQDLYPDVKKQLLVDIFDKTPKISKILGVLFSKWFSVLTNVINLFENVRKCEFSNWLFRGLFDSIARSTRKSPAACLTKC